MRRLLFFTLSYPFGIGEQWKTQELHVFRSYFDEIHVVPFSYQGALRPAVELPADIVVEEPLFREPNVVTMRDLPRVLNRHVAGYLRELIRGRAFRRKAWLTAWLHASLTVRRLLDKERLAELLRPDGRETVLYFFWGVGAAWIVPFIDPSRFANVVVRLHGFDLLRERNGGYIPYQASLLREHVILAPCSSAGAAYLRAGRLDVAADIRVRRLGTVSVGRSQPSRDGVLRLVSCAFLVPLKRITLIAEALRNVPFRVEWTHIGNGEQMDDLRRLTATLPAHVRTHLPGRLPSDQVLLHYLDHRVDLFVNVSAHEGVPVSVMEALSAGIPVLATDVGGTCEIVDERVGGLLPADVTPLQLAAALGRFNEKSAEDCERLRESAFARYEERCDAVRLAHEMAAVLMRREGISGRPLSERGTIASIRTA